MKVAVFGATGTIGAPLVERLADEHEVIAVSRRPHGQTRASVHSATADVVSGDGVAAALEGVDVAYYLVHSLGSRDFEEEDRRAAECLVRGAEAARVRQIVYLGGLGDDSPDLSAHLRSRRETGERLAAGSVPVTILRAAMVVGPGSAAFQTIVALVDRLPAMVTPKWVKTETQPIALDDVVRFLAGVCGREETFGRTYDAGGPEVMTYRRMMERIADIRGKRPVIVEVPVLSPNLSSLWLQLVTPVNASVARPLVEGLRNRTVAQEYAIREVVPGGLTNFDEAAREALAADSR